MASDDPFGKFLYLQNVLIKDQIQTFALTMNHADKTYTSMVQNSIQIHFILRLPKSNEQIMQYFVASDLESRSNNDEIA